MHGDWDSDPTQEGALAGIPSQPAANALDLMRTVNDRTAQLIAERDEARADAAQAESRLRAYRQIVALIDPCPALLAVEGSNEPVPIPRTESLGRLLDFCDEARAEAARLRAASADKHRETNSHCCADGDCDVQQALAASPSDTLEGLLDLFAAAAKETWAGYDGTRKVTLEQAVLDPRNAWLRRT